MDTFVWGLMILTFYVLLFGIPAALSYYLFKIIEKYFTDKRIYMFAFIPILAFGIIIKASYSYWIIETLILITLILKIRKEIFN